MESSCGISYKKLQKLLKEKVNWVILQRWKLALDTAGQEKQPVLYLCPDSWVVANALWWWLQVMEAEERWAHLGCCLVARCCCLGGDPGREGTPHGCSCTQELATKEHENNQHVDLDWQDSQEWIIYCLVSPGHLRPSRKKCNIVDGVMVEGWTWPCTLL